MESSPRPRLVLGIGNILRRDDGVGVHAIEALKAKYLPEDVELIDAGTAGADLLPLIAGRQKVIVLDALNAQGPAGAIYRLTPDDLSPRSAPELSLHDVSLIESLRFAKLLHCEPDEVVIFGVQPASIEFGLKLTEDVQSSVQKLTSLVLKELQSPCRRICASEPH